MPHRLAPAWFVLALSALGCDSEPPSGPIPVHPVSGQVLSNGKPVPGALVIFHPETPAASTPQPKPGEESPRGAITPTGKTDSEGRFQLHTYVGDDGAPTGQYKVTVVLAGPSENRDFMAKNSAPVSTVTLPSKYADPERSGLSATVKPGDNVIPPYEL